MARERKGRVGSSHWGIGGVGLSCLVGGGGECQLAY